MPVSERKQRRAACVPCRQKKVRCDKDEALAASCSRCVSSGQHCYVDTSFRRTAKRERLERLEQQVRELSTNHGNPVRNETASPTAPMASVPIEHRPLQDRLYSFVPTPRNVSAQSQEQSTPMSQRLGTVEFSRQEISGWVDEYYAHYHDKFPVLPSKQGLLQDLYSNPLLLWSVIVTASGGSRKDLCVQLAPAVKGLIAEQTLLSRPSLTSIQALLLLCCWPLPSEPAIGNPSWMYCGMATHQALLRGLHRPNYVSEYDFRIVIDEDAIATRVRTWVACFIVNQNLSAMLGLPATILPDHTILEVLASRPPSVPLALYNLLQISFQRHKFSTLLGQSERAADGLVSEPFSLIRTYEMEAGLFEQRDIAPWTPALMSINLAAKLNIYTYALMKFKVQENRDDTISRADTPQVAEYLSRAWSTAMKTVELRCSEETRRNFYSDMSLSIAPQSADEPAYWTLLESYSVLFAVCFLLKITRFWKIDPDPVATDNAITSAWNIFKSLSRTKDDIFARVCDIIKYIIKVDWSSCKERGMIVRSRMGANMAYEVVLRARDRFNAGRGQAQESHQSHQDTGTNNDDQNETNVGNADVENLFAAFTDDSTLPAAFDLLWEDWEAPDALFAGM